MMFTVSVGCKLQSSTSGLVQGPLWYHKLCWFSTITRLRAAVIIIIINHLKASKQYFRNRWQHHRSYLPPSIILSMTARLLMVYGLLLSLCFTRVIIYTCLSMCHCNALGNRNTPSSTFKSHSKLSKLRFFINLAPITAKTKYMLLQPYSST